MVPQEDIRYFWNRYLDRFWFVRQGRNPWAAWAQRIAFVLLVLALAETLIAVWGFTSSIETVESAKIPSGNLSNLADLWFTPSGKLVATQRQGWKVILWSWEPGNEFPGAPKTVDLDALTPKDESPPPVIRQVRVPNLVGKSFDVAKKMLYAASLRLGEIQWGNVGEGTLREAIVREQRPQAGENVSRGSAIHVVVELQRRPVLKDPKQSKQDIYRYKAPNSASQMQQSPIQQSDPFRRASPESKGTASANQPSSLSIPPRTEQALPVAASRDAMRVAWAWKGSLYVYHLATPGSSSDKPQLRRFQLSSNLPLAAIAILDHGPLAMQYQNGRLEIYAPDKKNELILTREGQGKCALVSSGAFLAYSCTNDESISVFESTPEGRINERKYAANQASLLPPALSLRGRLAVATIAGTVLLYDSGSQGLPLTVELRAPGLVQTIAFFDQDRVVVGGSFSGIHLLAADSSSQEVTRGVKATTFVAAQAPHLAFIADDGAMWLQLREVKRINRNGIIFLASGAALLLLYFMVPALRVYAEEQFQLREERVRRSLEYRADTAGQEQTPTLPLPPLPLDLVEACAKRNCVAYVGAGLAAQAGFPTWRLFVRGLLARVVQQQLTKADSAIALQAALEEGQTDIVADSLASELRGRQSFLNEYLQQVFLRGDVRLPAAYRALRDIPFSAILTTNFDDLLERNFQDSQPRVYTHRDASALKGWKTRRDNFFLLKLYGTLAQPDTVLLAPADFRKALRDLFLDFIKGLFVSDTILFVGASTEGIEANFREISFGGTMPHLHYALVNVIGSAWRAKAELLEGRYGIKILPYTAGSDFSEPAQFLEQLAQAVKPKTAAKDVVREVARLKSVTLHNIGPFENLRIDLDEHWNILLGDNGVGKSTIMKAIAVAICGQDAKDYAGRLIRSGRDDAAITLETNQGTHYVSTVVRKGSSAEVDTQPSPPMDAEGWLVLGFPPLRTMTWARDQEPPPSGIGSPTVDDVLLLAKGEIDPRLDKLKAWFLDLDHRIKDARLRQTSQSSAGKTRYEDLRDDFFSVISKVTPGLKIEYAGVNLDTKEVLIKTDDGLVPIEAVSQGTTSLLGWLGILMERLYDVYGQRDGAPTQSVPAIPPRERYALVLIDEIDAHMHPKWQQLIVRSLKQLFPNVQFLATTHSPLIVAGMERREVRVVRRAGKDEPEAGRVLIEWPKQKLKGLRADQILTGNSLFDLESTLDPDLNAARQRYTTLTAKDSLTPEEQRELERLVESLEIHIPAPHEREVARLAFEKMQQALEQELTKLSPEERKKLMDEAKVQVQENVTGSRRP